MKIIIGSDHGGFELKEKLQSFLKGKGYDVEDIGTYTEESCDYSEFSFKVAEAVAGGKADRGIIICKTGLGTCIAANKVRGARAVTAHNIDSAVFSRKHNDANILCLGAKYIDADLACEMSEKWLTTKFEAGRHKRRIDLIIKYEQE